VSTNQLSGHRGRPRSKARATGRGAEPAPRIIEREWVFSWLILTPPLLFLLCFLGYPFFYAST